MAERPHPVRSGHLHRSPDAAGGLGSPERLARCDCRAVSAAAWNGRVVPADVSPGIVAVTGAALLAVVITEFQRTA
jgi:hypothetical protein